MHFLHAGATATVLWRHQSIARLINPLSQEYVNDFPFCSAILEVLQERVTPEFRTNFPYLSPSSIPKQHLEKP
jgi:hypothetical protein